MRQISTHSFLQPPRVAHLISSSTELALRAGLALLFVMAIGMFSMNVGISTANARSVIHKLTNKNKMDSLILVVNKSETIKVDDSFSEIQVGNPEIADVLPLSDTSFYVLGKKTGATNLSIYDANRTLIGVLDIEISYDIPKLKQHLKLNLPNAKVRVSSLNGKILLTGTAPSASEIKQAMTIANQFAPDAVTSAMSVSSAQQVLLEVRFIEASRSAGRELGINFSASGKGIIAQTGAGLLSNSTPFGTFLGQILRGGFGADVIINALEDRGLARRLAEPNLIALSGNSASFLAGGEFPFPVAAKDGEITIEFKKFGVGLQFSPTVLPDGIINLEIEPEVSQLDPTNTLRLNNFDIPSLIVRRAHTTVELRDGQSFAIAGLLQSNHTKAHSQLPWIGDVPVLGALFRSSSFQKDETDLVIIITPRLVEPAAPSQKLASPLDSASPANDVDFFLFGKVEINKATLEYFKKGGGVEHAGHIIKGQEFARRTRYHTATLSNQNTYDEVFNAQDR